jgi:hypothetical protein
VSPAAEASDGADVYAALVHSPEFGTILRNLLAQQGLDFGDSETTDLLELLKNNPDFLKNYVQTAPPPPEPLEQPIAIKVETQVYPPEPSLVYETSATGLDSSQLFGPEPTHTTAPPPPPIPEPVSLIQQSAASPAPIPIPPPTKPKSITRGAISTHKFAAIPHPAPYVKPRQGVSVVRTTTQFDDRVLNMGFPSAMMGGLSAKKAQHSR